MEQLEPGLAVIRIPSTIEMADDGDDDIGRQVVGPMVMELGPAGLATVDRPLQEAARNSRPLSQAGQWPRKPRFMAGMAFTSSSPPVGPSRSSTTSSSPSNVRRARPPAFTRVPEPLRSGGKACRSAVRATGAGALPRRSAVGR